MASGCHFSLYVSLPLFLCLSHTHAILPLPASYQGVLRDFQRGTHNLEDGLWGGGESWLTRGHTVLSTPFTFLSSPSSRNSTVQHGVPVHFMSQPPADTWRRKTSLRSPAQLSKPDFRSAGGAWAALTLCGRGSGVRVKILAPYPAGHLTGLPAASAAPALPTTTPLPWGTQFPL